MAAGVSVDERVVEQVWERQAFDWKALDALGLRVLFRGMPSDAGGPDYQEAILIRDDGGLLVGDIEFHVCSCDWYRHGHDRDTRYNGVALHVVWRDDAPETRRADGVRVPVLEIGPPTNAPLPHGAGQRVLAIHPCRETFARLTDEELERAVRRLGWQRFDERVDRFEAEMEQLSPDQVLYAALLEGMGFASNRQQFLLLAEAIPIGWLLSVPADQRVSVLLDAAGLGPTSAVGPPARLNPDGWRLARLRPGNHPGVRIGGAVAVLNRLGRQPAQALAAIVAAAEKPADVQRALMARDGDGGLVGQGRANELAASAVLPFVAALDSGLSGPRRLYESFPSPPANRWTRVMAGLFDDAGHHVKVRTALQHQGIHLLYTRYCRRERAADCPICGNRNVKRG